MTAFDPKRTFDAALEQFLRVAEYLTKESSKFPPPGNVTAADAQAVLAWLREMVTKKPADLF